VLCRDVIKVFKTPAGEATVLKGISADIYQGQFVGVVGRSGSGKSTLVNMITGIDHPSSGKVQVAGTELHHMSEGQVAVWRGKTMGIVFQFFQLLPMLTLVENLMLPMDFCAMYAPAEREERAMRLLKRVGLAEWAHKLPGAISGGQQQSAAVARALATDPPIIMADEPTGNLDSRTAEDVIQLFEELVHNGKTILMVTHDPVLARRTGRTMIISDGELVNEAVSRAFPDLRHGQMLHLTQMAAPQKFTPDETIPAHPGKIYVVQRGSLLLFHEGGALAETYTTNQFVDPAHLHLGRKTGLNLRAGSEGAEVLAFDHGPAYEILGDAMRMVGLPEEERLHTRNPFRGWLGWLRRP
jgi:putative ABC transport system ATP-binding protein